VKVKIVLPTNKLSGGTLQAIELSKDLEQCGIHSDVICIFRHHEKFYKNNNLSFITNYTLPIGKLKLPFFIFVYLRYLIEIRKVDELCIYTHFFTYPIFRNHKKFMLYLQGRENTFIKNQIFSLVIKKFISHIASRSKLNIIVSKSLSFRCNSEILLPNVLPTTKKIQQEHKDLKLLFCYSNSHVKNPIFYESVCKHKDIKKGFKIGVVELSPFPYQHGNVIKFAPQTQKDFHKIQSRSDYFLVASLSEGFGLTVIEALMNGAIVFVTEFGGIGDELLRDIPFCKVTQPKEVIEKIHYLESNKLEKEKLKDKCMKFLEKSEKSRALKRSEALFKIASKIVE